MLACGPVTPASYGIVRDVKNAPWASAVALPRATSVADTPGELSGPCIVIATDSPGRQFDPCTATWVFQVNTSGWRLPPAWIPPETDTVAAGSARVANGADKVKNASSAI